MASTARTTIVTASAIRRPRRKRSSSGPISAATTTNGTNVTTRNSATRLRASCVGTEKNSDPANATATIASPPVCSTCTSTSCARPDSPAPPRRFHSRSRRKPAATTASRWPTAPRKVRPAPRRGGAASVCGDVPGGAVVTDQVSTRAEAAGTTLLADLGIVSAVTAVDACLADAVDLARAQAEQEAPGLVGEHLDVVSEDDRLATHYFETLDPAYRGWRWAVTVTRAARSRSATVDEVVLVAGEEA